MTFRPIRPGLLALALALVLLCGPALAQKTPLYQSGTASARDAVKVTTNGLLEKAGGLLGDANGRGLNPYSVSDALGLGQCFNSAQTGGANQYNALCLGHDSSHNGLITLDSYGGLAGKSLYFRINGSLYEFPGDGQGNILGPVSSVVANLAAWNNTAGTLLKDGLIGVNTYSGLVTSHTGTGSVASNRVYFNKFVVNSDNIALTGSDQFHAALHVTHNFGGAAMTGGTGSLWVDSLLTAPTAAGNTNRNYVAVYGRLWGNSDDGGTGTTQATAKGALFGGHFVGSSLTGATNLLNVAGAEISVDAQTGSSGWLKSILSLVPESTDAVSFTHNVGLSIGKKGGVGLDVAISLNDFHGSSALKTTGCVICNQTTTATPPAAGSLGTIQTGIDLSYYVITGSFLHSNSYEVTGGGIVTQVLDGTRFTGGDATYRGDLQLIGNSVQAASALHNGGLEFKVSNSGDGYGFRLVGNDLGAGASELLLESRSNAAGWSGVLSVRADTASTTIYTAVNFDGVTRLKGYAVAGLPACDATLDGHTVRVTDAAAPTYAAAPTGGGSLKAIVTCTNGTGWRLQ